MYVAAEVPVVPRRVRTIENIAESGQREACVTPLSNARINLGYERS